jgi:protocatechuate 3,4-dioxygenase beta subunit
LRTRPLKDAAEDIAFLESLSQPASGGFVYGVVWFTERGLSPSFKPEALKDATVVVEGMGTRRETKTDASGHYRFTGLPPGSYDVSVVLQGHLAATRVDYADAHAPVHETPVRSAVVIDGPRDCAEANFSTQSNGRISGFASVEGGRPVDGVVVLAALVDEVRRADAARERSRPSYLFSGKAVTGADGSFEFTNLPPGRYVVGVSLEHNVASDHPYPRMFYPGVAALEDAAVVELQRGEQLQIGNLTLPAPLTQTIVQGSVVGMDGQPAVGAQVVAVNNWGASAGSMFTKEDGRFRLTLYSNHSYRLRATLRDKQGAIVAETTRQLDAPEGAGEPLRLVLKPPVAK